MRGLIVKGIAGFYYVRYGSSVYQCRARGIFKKEGITPAVGDLVEFETLDDEEGVINEILPRRNHFIRPPIANIDCFFVVISTAQPKLNMGILDKFLVTAEMAKTPAVICVNKVDLTDGEDLRQIRKIYGGIYPVVELSCVTGKGMELLPDLMKNRKSALAGPSGVGKSTIINKLQRGLDLDTGIVSRKTERGKHTTRHVELFETDFGALLFDTPGFTSFDLSGSDLRGLSTCFPEMREYQDQCRFDDCLHLKEPDCAVKQAVRGKVIARSRYESYERQMNELLSRASISGM
jgi:ribosome biogenesis GTPase